MELNIIHPDSDFNNTIVPEGQRFLFLGYVDGVKKEEEEISADNIVIRYKDSEGNYGSIASGGAGNLNQDITDDNIESIDDKYFVILENSAIPAFIKTSKGNIYPIEKNTLTEDGEKFIIELEPYLAYDNVTELTLPWTVYFGGGSKGAKGEKGDTGKDGKNALTVNKPIVETLSPDEDATADVEISAYGEVTFKFGIPKGEIGKLNVVVSEEEPENPFEGMIWAPSL